MELKDREYELKLTKEFIESKGLRKELDRFIQDKLAAKEEELKKVSVGDLNFAFEGHYSKYCYELSAGDFDESSSLNYLLYSELFGGLYDPNSTDPIIIEEYEKNKADCIPVTEALTETELETVFNRLMKFINEENDTFTYYKCDKFGFTDRQPTREEIFDWFKSLMVSTKYDWIKDLKHEKFERTF